jgi:hypothetical protein
MEYMRSFLGFAGVIWLIIVGPLPPALQSADPVIRVTVYLVQMDAVVTDSKGHHIADRKQGVFEILEDGRPQKITHFSYAQRSTAASALKPLDAGGPEA